MSNTYNGKNMGCLWFIGATSPPINGQSLFNDQMQSLLVNRSRKIRFLPIGGDPVEKILRALINPFSILLQWRRGDIVYTSPPGQMGLWLFLLTVLALRLRGAGHFVHHHSYRAINLGPLLSSRLLCLFGGSKQRHIFFSARMAEAYGQLYLTLKQRAHVLVLPNAFLFPMPLEDSLVVARAGPVTLGHLSVMTPEKGVKIVLELTELLLAQGCDIRLVLAGPVKAASLSAQIYASIARYPDKIEWRGPVTGADKARFYREIDLFILPTMLVDEADPLVILEAYSAGVAVLASDRGCISERLMSNYPWLLTMDLESDASRLAQAVSICQKGRCELARAARSQAIELHKAAIEYARVFFTALESPLPSEIHINPVNGRASK
ncbi:glycosyltransferase family 4 protein [Stenotrophomonas sp. MMGLT7]|uniref:glycosyltransferase family 4 protein n=1 Tax=Stenotrophomonas sp. MMGLT7 TaxID=2901227 RepID=UPI001E46A995|nr:glycosyltransferase family 4 protein [Stenotrophomonas sp. MMGLT7]MCD7099312.1 glycosyltransferase family 4 protein [Stenotrophomonas sp. MMGLT7]